MHSEIAAEMNGLDQMPADLFKPNPLVDLTGASWAAHIGGNVMYPDVKNPIANPIVIPPSFDPNAAVFDPVWLRSDCNCRGGNFVEVLGQPQNSYCLPGPKPTGKAFSLATRGCVPISGVGASFLPGVCFYKGHNICLYAGLALGALIVSGVLLKKKKGKHR